MGDSKITEYYEMILMGKESECYRKLALVLLKVLQPNFKTSDDTVLPKLMDFIKRQGNLTNSDHLVVVQILSEWIEKACHHWSLLCTAGKVLALNMAGYVASTMDGFARLSSSGCLTSILSHLHDQDTATSSTICSGFLTLMDSVLSISKGSHILLQSGIWRKVVNLALSSSNLYCFQQSTKLLATMLMAADDITSVIILNELLRVSGPSPQLLELLYLAELEPSSAPKTPLSQDNQIKTLNACRMTILSMMDREHPVCKINHLIKSSGISSWTWSLLTDNTDKRVLDAANKLACVLNALHFYQCRDEAGLIPFDASKNIIDVILNHLLILKTQKLYYELLDACADYQIHLHKYGTTVAPMQEVDTQGRIITDVPFKIHNLVLGFMSTPALLCLRIRQDNSEVDILEEYFDKLFRMTSSKVMRQAASYRDSLVSLGEQVCIFSTAVVMKHLQASRIIRKEQAILVFQGTVHLIAEFVATPEEGTHKRSFGTFTMDGEELLAAFPALLSASLNCLICYLGKFDFSWRDSLESLSLMSSLQRLLDSTTITEQTTVEVLKLIDLVLNKFMPPNLALLVDTIKGSSIEDLGPQLYRLIHSTNWAVKDSALEVLKTICSLSESKFPAFQALLIERKLPELIFSIIDTDSEPFVRSTAISCLYELAKVPNVWKATLSNKNVTEKLLLILYYETEGIVRVAAAKTVSVMHSLKSISTNELELVYDVMSHVARNDLHWEVRVECLEFWKWVLIHSVLDIGMNWTLDFPEFVFSKESKKIIKLTPEEISRRVLKTSKICGEVGCFQVLYDSLVNEADLAVQRKSAKLHKMVSMVTTKFPPARNPEGTSNQSSSEVSDCDAIDSSSTEDMQAIISTPTFEETIESIAATDDVELLEGLVCSPDVESKKTLPHLKRVVMSNLEFKRKMQDVDVNRVLEEREEWVSNSCNSVVSLLDDILLFMNKIDGATQTEDINSMDCY